MTETAALQPEGGDHVQARQTVDLFLEAKLHRPPARQDWINRARLLDQLDRAVTRRVTLVAAPAGYGKTTLVAQWLSADRSAPAAAWVSLDAGDNDPGRLWTHVGAALERVGCVVAPDLSAFMAANSAAMLTGVLPRMVNAMAAMPDPILLLLDDFHLVQTSECRAQVEFLVEHLPPQAHLFIITRADPGLRLGRLRATGGLAEVRADDLSFNSDEASSLLAGEQVQLSGAAVEQLMVRTEGWPAGLYLAALSLSGRPDPETFVRDFSGGNRFIGDYLTEEVLSRHSDQTRAFITSMSILDRMSAPLCDFVAEGTGSAGLLQDLERTNLFLVPLDEARRWFRFHHLFAAVARSELEARHPDQVPLLHARAAVWFRDHGHIDEAVSHFILAGRTSEAALLVQAHWLRYVDAGRMATVLGWLDALGTPSIGTDPAAGVTAAWMAALTGDQAALTRQLESLEASRDHGPLPDGTRSVESAIALIRGYFGFGGPVEMLTAARRAVELETDGRSPFFVMAQLAYAHSAYVTGDLGLATALLSKATNNEAAPVMVRVLSLSIQSLVEAECGQPERSAESAELAMEIVELHGMQAMHQTSLAFTALGQAQAAAGKLPDAMSTLERGLALRRRNPALSPWPMTHHLLVMARVALDAGQAPLAQELSAEASSWMDAYREGMGTMRARLAAIQAVLRSRTASAANGEPLTARELDVLQHLQGSLSLNEIARELYLSPNTVKTHAKALYRKLGASSRTEALQAARQRLLI